MIWTWDIIRRIIEVLWLINIGFAIWTVFRSRRDIAATWAWLLVLSVFPVAGFILYMFVGRQLSHDDIFTIQEEQAKYQNTFLKKQHRLLEQHELLPQSNQKPRARMLVNLNLNNDEALLTFDNHVEVFTDGHAKFEQLIDDINHAKKSLMSNTTPFMLIISVNEFLMHLSMLPNEALKSGSSMMPADLAEPSHLFSNHWKNSAVKLKHLFQAHLSGTLHHDLTTTSTEN